ncbi:hypothetical protein RND71_038565 [Anisodus tanguticus]|uniref:Uncharacterized protein n=1 Tax=Anisodus tanguticus TaxID=243964 RepID=A0AAE1QZA5_9SOLA|nr:hypothetical protein RND71_038565 [Anisodus tanguticus]
MAGTKGRDPARNIFERDLSLRPFTLELLERMEGKGHFIQTITGGGQTNQTMPRGPFQTNNDTRRSNISNSGKKVTYFQADNQEGHFMQNNDRRGSKSQNMPRSPTFKQSTKKAMTPIHTRVVKQRHETKMTSDSGRVTDPESVDHLRIREKREYYVKNDIVEVRCWTTAPSSIKTLNIVVIISSSPIPASTSAPASTSKPYPTSSKKPTPPIAATKLRGSDDTSSSYKRLLIPQSVTVNR